MKVYTRTGDTGNTSLIGGKRVSKTCQRIESYGTIDEVMNLQVSINQLRNRFNIPDETQMTKSNEGFVQ